MQGEVKVPRFIEYEKLCLCNIAKLQAKVDELGLDPTIKELLVTNLIFY
jgi:hypothetical protein